MAKEIRWKLLTKPEDIPVINTSLIPEHVQYDVCKAVYEAVTNYFKQPGVQEKYEIWLKERRAKEELEQQNAIEPIPL